MAQHLTLLCVHGVPSQRRICAKVAFISNRLVVTALASLTFLASTIVSAQVLVGVGTADTKCTQSGLVLSCTSTTLFNLPAAVSLQAGGPYTAFTLGGGTTSGAPTCASGLLAAVPASVQPNTSTNVQFAIAGCPAGVTYNWINATSAVSPADSTAGININLPAGISHTSSVNVCSPTNAQSCTLYSVTVAAAGVTTPPLLSGCTINAPTTVVAIGASPILSAQCSQGTPTSYLWQLNGGIASGVSNGSTYAIPPSATTSGAVLQYSVVLTSANGGATPAAPVNVATASQNACNTSGSPDTTINYATPFVNLNGIRMGGVGAVYIIKYVVAASDSSIGKSLPNYVGTNSPVTQYSHRTVTISPCPNDFNSPNAVLLARGGIDFSIEFTTQRARAGNGVAYVEPGRTYYINVKNENCATGQVCSLDGQYNNSN